MSGHYTIDKEGNVSLEPNLEKWAKSFQANTRRIAGTRVFGIYISTIFLGLDHSFGSGPPILFETMIFGGINDQYQKRYVTLEEAKKGHKETVLLVLKTLPQSFWKWLLSKLKEE